MDAIVNLRSLRAVRAFDGRPVPEQVLRDLLEVARWTGTAKNGQHIAYVVVREKRTLASLRDISPDSGAHLGSADFAVAPVLDRAVSDNLDLGRATERLMLAAHAHGVGSCIAGFRTEDARSRAAHVLGVPETHRLPFLISFGYRAAVQPSRNLPGRKPVGEIAFAERFGTKGT